MEVKSSALDLSQHNHHHHNHHHHNHTFLPNPEDNIALHSVVLTNNPPSSSASSSSSSKQQYTRPLQSRMENVGYENSFPPMSFSHHTQLDSTTAAVAASFFAKASEKLASSTHGGVLSSTRPMSNHHHHHHHHHHHNNNPTSSMPHSPHLNELSSIPVNRHSRSAKSTTSSSRSCTGLDGPNDDRSSTRRPRSSSNHSAQLHKLTGRQNNTSNNSRNTNGRNHHHRTNFSRLLKHSSPPLPSPIMDMLTALPTDDVLPLRRGMFKALARLHYQECSSRHARPLESVASKNSCISVDPMKRQITFFDPRTRLATTNSFTNSSHEFTNGSTTPQHRVPKMFAMDSVFSEDDSQLDVANAALSDIIQGVVTGSDGCVICLGHSGVGKTYTMVGDSNADISQAGIIPTAIAWLFQVVNEMKQQTKARFSIRVSAVEVCGNKENLVDLLSAEEQGGNSTSGSYERFDHCTAPSVYLRDDPINGTQMENYSELRAPTAQKAAHYLDAALAARSKHSTSEEANNFSSHSEASSTSHLLFTIHIYQYRVEQSGAQSGVTGGRSRLHLIDLGSGRSHQNNNNTNNNSQCGALSLAGIASVLLALVNGQRHIPHRESKLSQLLREAMGSLQCNTTIIAQISSNVQQHQESLQIIQVVSKMYRLRRRRGANNVTHRTGFNSNVSDSGSSCGEMSAGLSRRLKNRLRPQMGLLRTAAAGGGGSSSSSASLFLSEGGGGGGGCTSSSEMSCDTAIFIGGGYSTDGERPPAVLSRSIRAVLTEPESDTGLGGHLGHRTQSQCTINSGPNSFRSNWSFHSTDHVINNNNNNNNKNSRRPRTNARVWPRMAARNAIETLSTQKEQWVDGPKAVFTPPPPPPPPLTLPTTLLPQQPHATFDPYHALSEQQINRTTDVPPTPVPAPIQLEDPIQFKPTDDVNQDSTSVSGSSSCSTCPQDDAPVLTEDTPPPPPILPDLPPDTTEDPLINNNTQGTSHDSSTYSTIDRKNNRVLSDISERSCEDGGASRRQDDADANSTVIDDFDLDLDDIQFSHVINSRRLDGLQLPPLPGEIPMPPMPRTGDTRNTPKVVTSPIPELLQSSQSKATITSIPPAVNVQLTSTRSETNGIEKAPEPAVSSHRVRQWIENNIESLPTTSATSASVQTPQVPSRVMSPTSSIAATPLTSALPPTTAPPTTNANSFPFQSIPPPLPPFMPSPGPTDFKTPEQWQQWLLMVHMFLGMAPPPTSMPWFPMMLPPGTSPSFPVPPPSVMTQPPYTPHESSVQEVFRTPPGRHHYDHQDNPAHQTPPPLLHNQPIKTSKSKNNHKSTDCGGRWLFFNFSKSRRRAAQEREKKKSQQKLSSEQLEFVSNNQSNYVAGPQSYEEPVQNNQPSSSIPLHLISPYSVITAPVPPDRYRGCRSTVTAPVGYGGPNNRYPSENDVPPRPHPLTTTVLGGGKQSSSRKGASRSVVNQPTGNHLMGRYPTVFLANPTGAGHVPGNGNGVHQSMVSHHSQRPNLHGSSGYESMIAGPHPRREDSCELVFSSTGSTTNSSNGQGVGLSGMEEGIVSLGYAGGDPLAMMRQQEKPSKSIMNPDLQSHRQRDRIKKNKEENKKIQKQKPNNKGSADPRGGEKSRFERAASVPPNQRFSNSSSGSTVIFSRVLDPERIDQVVHDNAAQSFRQTDRHLSSSRTSSCLPQPSIALTDMMQRQIRQEKIAQLAFEQECLKMEMKSVMKYLKSGVGGECDVTQQLSAMQRVLSCKSPEDPDFLQAFESETQVMREFVNSCKSRLYFVTAFDATGGAGAKSNPTHPTSMSVTAQDFSQHK